MEKYDLSLLTSHDFAALKGENFSVHLAPDMVITTKLIQVTEFKSFSPLARLPFSLIFKTVGTLNGFPQGTYVMENNAIGNLDVFLVPIGPDPDGMKYEAVFS